MENLVVEAKKGNKEAYSELFGSVYNDLYKIAMSKVHNDADAKDAIQNAFFTAFKNINNLHHNKNFKAWISRILRNKCYALLRKRKETTTSLEDYPSPDFNTDNIDDIVDFRNMLERLNKVEKEVIKLKYEDGLSIKEISSLLNINENTVKTHLSRGKQKLSRSIKPVTIMIILCAFLVTSVIAACIISYVKELFDINSAGRHNEGVLEAIEHLEWFQDVDMDYIDLGDGYKIKVDYLLMDEMNLYLIFDFMSENDISQFEDITLPTLKIDNEYGDVICDRTKLFSNQYGIYVGDKIIENTSHHMKYLVSIYTDSFPISKTLNINFSKITLAKKIQNKIEIYRPSSFSIDLLDKFIERDYISYIPNNNAVKRAIITETGFYSIITLENTDILKKISLVDANNTHYKCYYTTLTYPDLEKRKYIVFSNYNSTDSDTLKLIIDNNEYFLLKN